MEQEKNNKGVIAILVVIIIILLALVILFATGTISLKSNNSNNNISESNKINDIANDTSNDENQQVNNNNDDNPSTTVGNDSNRVNKVYISENNTGYYLILWDDGTYKYINGDATSGTFGKYSLNNEKLVLYYMFSIDSNNKNKVNIVDGMKTLKVVGQTQIIDNDITLNSSNQSAREGAQNIYTNLYSMLKYYDDEQKKVLGIN